LAVIKNAPGSDRSYMETKKRARSILKETKPVLIGFDIYRTRSYSDSDLNKSLNKPFDLKLTEHEKKKLKSVKFTGV